MYTIVFACDIIKAILLILKFKMKKIFISIIFAVFVFILTSSVAQATDIPVQKVVDKATLIATVDIANAKIVSQEGNTFNISFDITNKQIPEPDVRYGIRLIKESTNSQLLVDEKVYDESFYLSENTSVSKNIIYQAPASLSGSYMLLLNINKSSGLPLAISRLGIVTLAPLSKGIEIVPDSCDLSVVGEKTNKVYTLRQGVVIKDTENLKMSCDVINSTDSNVTLTPSFVTNITTSFGKVVETTGGDIAPITFKIGEKKQVSVVLPKANKVENYSMSFLLKNVTIVSNSVIALYRIYGSNATVLNLSLDKDYYKKGEIAQVAFSWFPANNYNPKARLSSPEAPSPVSLKLDFTNGRGKACADPITQKLSLEPKDSQVSIPVSMKSQCKDPIITATLLGDNGNIFDSKVFEFKSDMSKQSSGIPYIVLIIIPLLIVILLLLCKKGGCKLCKVFTKNSNPNPSNTGMPMSVIFPFFIFIALSFFFSFGYEAKADTYKVGVVSITINTPSYDSTVATVPFYGTTFTGQADEFQYSLLFYGALDTTGHNLIDASSGSHSSFSFNTTFPMPTTPGTHDAVFNAESYYDEWKWVTNPLFTDGRGDWKLVNTGHFLEFSIPIVVPGGPDGGNTLPTVSVTVNDSKTPTSITKSAAMTNGVTVSWTSGGGAVKCTCTYPDTNGDGNPESCGSGVGSDVKGKTPAGGTSFQISKTTKFSVKCSNSYDSLIN